MDLAKQTQEESGTLDPYSVALIFLLIRQRVCNIFRILKTLSPVRSKALPMKEFSAMKNKETAVSTSKTSNFMQIPSTEEQAKSSPQLEESCTLLR